MTVDKPGIYNWMPLNDYHAGPGVSNSVLTAIGTRSPEHCKYQLEHQEPPTDPQRVGEAFHTLVLEPHLFRDRFYMFMGDLRSKAQKELWAEKEAEGLIIVREKQLDNVLGMVKAVREHPDADPLLYKMEAEFEKSVYWIDKKTGLLCKVRPDIVPRHSILNAIGDLKSCRPGVNRDPRSWAKQIGMYRYHVQAGLYLEGCTEAMQRPYLGFYWITVESEAPYGVNVFMADKEMIAEGRRIFRTDLNIYADCVEQNMWPGYEEGVTTVRLSKWDMKHFDNEGEE